MAFSTDDLATLEKAIAQGVTKVKYTDKEIDYRSLEEMKEIRNTMMKELGLLKKGPNRTFASVSKGLDRTGSRRGGDWW